MIPIRTRELAGVDVIRGADVVVEGLTSDSRRAGRGDLFVAVRGGVEHLGGAVERGADALLVPPGAVSAALATGAPAVLAAEDTIAALQALGAQNRGRSQALVVAVTGSAGKTSTKDLLAALLAPLGPVVAAEHGHNNEIGLPLTLARIRPETRVCVVEMGMRGPGQIRLLADLARPRAGLITNIGVAHLELLGSREAIAAAKAELLHALPAGASAVVPAGEPLLASHLAGLRPVTFGEEAGADVRVAGRTVTGAGQEVALVVAGRRYAVEARAVGAHQALNLAAAAAMAFALGLDLDESLPLAVTAAPSRWRDEVHPLPGGGIVVNDAWNANPPAVVAALTSLAERGDGRLVAVLGSMAELGAGAGEFHRRVGETASALGYGVIIAVGEPARGFLEGAGPIAEPYFLPDSEALLPLLDDVVRPGDRILIKGSRAGALEGIAEDLVRRLAERQARAERRGSGS